MRDVILGEFRTEGDGDNRKGCAEGQGTVGAGKAEFDGLGGVEEDQQQLWADWEDLCVHASGGL